MMTILFALFDRSKWQLVHNLVSNHHQGAVEVEITTEYVQDYGVALPLVVESCIDVSAHNTKGVSL